jgi:hypothetical protein
MRIKGDGGTPTAPATIHSTCRPPIVLLLSAVAASLRSNPRASSPRWDNHLFMLDC